MDLTYVSDVSRKPFGASPPTVKGPTSHDHRVGPRSPAVRHQGGSGGLRGPLHQPHGGDGAAPRAFHLKRLLATTTGTACPGRGAEHPDHQSGRDHREQTAVTKLDKPQMRVTQQDDVEILSHYADQDGPECVQALLVLLAVHNKQIRSADESALK